MTPHRRYFNQYVGQPFREVVVQPLDQGGSRWQGVARSPWAGRSGPCTAGRFAVHAGLRPTGDPACRPRGGTSVRHPVWRSCRVTASVVVAALLTTGPAGCSAPPDPRGDTLVIGADLNSSSAVDRAYAR